MSRDIGNSIAIGWREWVTIPLWGIDYIKAKVDTGARTSCLHVDDIEEFEKEGKLWISFKVYPWQKNKKDYQIAEAPLVEKREIRSSSGHKEARPVVETEVMICGLSIKTEITLTNRDQMGFRMLLGRETIKEDFFVLAGKSYIGGKPSKVIRDQNRRLKSDRVK